jgi:hypothetical protein
VSKKPRWEQGKIKEGIKQVKLSSCKFFSDYINQVMLDHTNYIYRGHGDSKWKLEPTLDRFIKNPTSNKRNEHLEKFKYETRGRRGETPALIEDENDWWALGQHHGLLTPLLDWSESPFVALYFATISAQKENKRSYSVFALNQLSVAKKNEYIESTDNIDLINKRKPMVKIVRPLSNENSRLVCQRGLFTRGPNNMDLESWIKKFPQEPNTAELIKLTIPTTGIVDCLRYLNRMNINHSTLFPDLTGASEHCNKYLLINKY